MKWKTSDAVLLKAAIILWLLIVLLSCVIMREQNSPVTIGGKHREEARHMMTNCANPEGVRVIETGRVIDYGYSFVVYGNEIVNEYGTFWRVEDGTISADYICEVR